MKRETISVKGVNYERFEINPHKKLDTYFDQLYNLIDDKSNSSERGFKNIKIKTKKFSAIGTWNATDANIFYYVRYFEVIRKRYERVLLSDLNLDDKLKLVKELSKIYVL